MTTMGERFARVVALSCAGGALGAALVAVFHAAVLGRAGLELGVSALLAAVALCFDYPPYDPGPRGLPGAPRAGIDTQE